MNLRPLVGLFAGFGLAVMLLGIHQLRGRRAMVRELATWIPARDVVIAIGSMFMMIGVLGLVLWAIF